MLTTHQQSKIRDTSGFWVIIIQAMLGMKINKFKNLYSADLINGPVCIRLVNTVAYIHVNLCVVQIYDVIMGLKLQ